MKTALRRADSTAIASPRVSAELLSQAQSYLIHHENDNLAAHGLEPAWSAFYEICTSKICKFAFRCGMTENDIADCLQDVWTELIARLPTFELDPNRGHFETWLFRIVQSKSVNLRRDRQRSLMQESADTLRTLADDRTSSNHFLESEEMANLAWILLRKKLSERNLQIVQMRLVEERPVSEVAEKLGLSHAQVWYRCHRARRELEEIGAALKSGQNTSLRANGHHDENYAKIQQSAQGPGRLSVSRTAGSRSCLEHGGNCVDYVFQRLELGRRELSPEWKVEWNCDGEPKPVLYVRKMAIVAYGEICGSADFINAHWPRIVNAAIAAGVAAGIATIIATPTAAQPIFQAEFSKQVSGKRDSFGDEKIWMGLSAKVEASGVWCVCNG